MSININENNLLCKVSDRSIKIVLSPEAKQHKNYEKNNEVLAELLSWLKSFYKLIDEIRKKVGLKHIIKFPEINSSDEILDLVQGDVRKKILDGVAIAIKKYGLNTNWIESLTSVVLTNTLLIPFETEGIHILNPYPLINTPTKKWKNISAIQNELEKKLQLLSIGRYYGYPSIYFTQKVSIKKIIEFILKNKEYINKSLLSPLPKIKTIKAHPHTFLWGQIAWILKNEGIKKWSDMEKFIENNKKIKIKPIPNQIEIRKQYHTFLKYLRQIENQDK